MKAQINMVRDYSEFLSSKTNDKSSQKKLSKIQTLGWQPFFAQQISVEELTETPPVRVTEVHRSGLCVLGDGIDEMIPPRADATVGDWVLLDRELPHSSKVLERKSLIKRRAPGTDRQTQLIAANIDTVFIVSSCNQDFNIARLERYIALVFQPEITTVIVLTKTDLAPSIDKYVEEAQSISDAVPVVALDARGDEPKTKLAEWCKLGQTVAFIGSSGVGKSTLTNALSGTQAAETQDIREDDAKGRHTTTRRQLHIVPDGFLVLDTPGMRELQLTDAASGIDDIFGDLNELATQCKFNDCQHLTEPGCAINQAVEDGSINEKRLHRWRKLIAEDAYNSASLLERKSKARTLDKVIRKIQNDNMKTK